MQQWDITIFLPIIDQVGGGEVFSHRLANELARRGHRITLLGTQPMSQWRRGGKMFETVGGLRIIRLPAWQRSPQTFERMLVTGSVVALHVFLRHTQILHLNKLAPETLALARFAKRRHIKTICVPWASGPFGDVATFLKDRKRASDLPDWVSAKTEDIRREVIQWGYPADRIGVIPNGVDTSLFSSSEQPPPSKRAIFVGQFRPEKRVDLLLRAWTILQTRYPETRLTLIGGGQNLTLYQQMAAELGLAPTFVPNVAPQAVCNHLRQHGVFIMSGISEGMSNALLESMAVGLAPVVSDTPGNRAVVMPEINGLCYDPDSPEALAAAVERLFLDENLRQRLGAAARQTVIQRYSLEAVVGQYEQLYATLLSR